MRLWTVSAQRGVAGFEIAAGLARRADVPLYDCDAFEGAADGCGRLNTLALSAAASAGSSEAAAELVARRSLPGLACASVRESARGPGVVYSVAAFAALVDHPGAVHVRLHAPADWRIECYARSELVDLETARRAIRSDDRRQRGLGRMFGRVDIDDVRVFSIAVDASRFTPAQVIDMIFASSPAPSYTEAVV